MEFYSQELNFREWTQNEDINFRIVPKPYSYRGHDHQGIKGTKRDPNTVNITMHLPTTIKKAFMDFRDVHVVFAGRFSDEVKGICKGKSHVRLTPFKSKHDLPHEVKFGDDNRFFHAMRGQKNTYCKKCMMV